MKALYTGTLRKVLQWAGRIKKRDIIAIVDKMVEVDAKDVSGEEKASEVATFIGDNYVPSSHKWIINLLVQGIFAYARYKGKL